MSFANYAGCCSCVEVPPSEFAEDRSLSRSSARALFELESFFDSGELHSARLKRGAQGTGRRPASDRVGALMLQGRTNVWPADGCAFGPDLWATFLCTSKERWPAAARRAASLLFSIAAGDSSALTLALSQRERERLGIAAGDSISNPGSRLSPG